MQYVNAEKTPNGNLKLVLLPEAREDLLDLYHRMMLRDVGEKADAVSIPGAEADVLEDLIGNGFTHVQPEDVGALTSAPMIAEDFECDEETGEPRVVAGGRVYAYMDYQVRSFVEDLAERGYALWTGAVVESKAK